MNSLSALGLSQCFRNINSSKKDTTENVRRGNSGTRRLSVRKNSSVNKLLAIISLLRSFLKMYPTQK